MKIEVVETLKGATEDRRLVVFGGDGMLCRPDISRFPVGSAWVLALNGPGSKAGVEGGWALSICGEYWLEVKGREVIGNFDDDLDQHTVQAVPLADFAARLANRLAAAPRTVERFEADVHSGTVFSRGFGGRFTLVLVPLQHGWLLQVHEAGRSEDLSRLTPPLHSVPNPREIEGWHFRNADNSGPNEAGENNLNVPGAVRRFVFSPEVGLSIDGPSSGRQVTPADLETIGAFGQGRLEILENRLAVMEPGGRASFEWIRFSVVLSYPSSSEPQSQDR
jgi:hypothetical protein